MKKIFILIASVMLSCQSGKQNPEPKINQNNYNQDTTNFDRQLSGEHGTDGRNDRNSSMDSTHVNADNLK